MSIRIQVIVDEEEAARFKSQAIKESKSLSAWLRDAGRKLLNERLIKEDLTEPETLRSYFHRCDQDERGEERDWEEYKTLLLRSYQSGEKP